MRPLASARSLSHLNKRKAVVPSPITCCAPPQRSEGRKRIMVASCPSAWLEGSRGAVFTAESYARSALPCMYSARNVHTQHTQRAHTRHTQRVHSALSAHTQQTACAHSIQRAHSALSARTQHAACAHSALSMRTQHTARALSTRTHSAHTKAHLDLNLER